MNDVMLENGDIKLDPTGAAVILNEAEAKIQRVLICASALKGRFIYDRSLGSEYNFETDIKTAEMLINEAAASYDAGYIHVLECGESLVLGIETDDGIIEREVRFYGNL